MESSDDVTGPMNLGNPDEIAIRELAESVIDLTGSSSDIVHLPSPEDDPARRCPDISLARQVLRLGAEGEAGGRVGNARSSTSTGCSAGRPMYDDPLLSRPGRGGTGVTRLLRARLGKVQNAPVPDLLTEPTRSRVVSAASDPCSRSRTIEDMYTTVRRWLLGPGTYEILIPLVSKQHLGYNIAM